MAEIVDLPVLENGSYSVLIHRFSHLQNARVNLQKATKRVFMRESLDAFPRKISGMQLD
jgi:hypothetical protein